MRVAVLGLLPVLGCDLVLDLQDSPMRPGDATAADTAVDAVPCESTTTHDEDNDGLFDLCDPCPAGGDNTDTDGDGVGDSCGDPDPQLACSRRVFFDGFGSQDPRLVTTDLVEVIPDDLVQPEVNGVTTTATYPVLAYDNVIVRAAIGDIQFAGGSFGRVEIASGTTFSNGEIREGHACQLTDNSGVRGVRIATVSGDSQIIAGDFDGVSAGDLVFELRNFSDGEVICSVTGLQGAGATNARTAARSAGSIAFFANGGAAKVRWIEVLESTCSR